MKKTLFILFNLVFLFANPAHAEQGTVIEHPGSKDLVYLGIQPREKPLSPLRKVRIGDKFLFIYPQVIIPSIQSMYLLENSVINEGDVVLDIGTGSGVQAIFAAEKAKKIIATDLDKEAVENVLYNAKLNHVANKIEARQGDLFNPINKGEKFDVILFNIIYPYLEDDKYGLWKVHERFFNEVKNYLKPNGRIYYQTGLVRNIAKTLEMITKNDLKIVNMNMYLSEKYDREPIIMFIKPK